MPDILVVMATIDHVCDYVILMCDSAGERLNLLKLQKLLYYVQAWSLAFENKTLFDGKFQAWIHGPVNREIYDRFKDAKSLYSTVTEEDIRDGFDPDVHMTPSERLHVQNVLEVYAPLSDSELESQTHIEEPWIIARGKCRPTQRCETELDEGLMGIFYRARLKQTA